MGECFIKRMGGFIDTSELTAMAPDVLSGKTFVKPDGEKGTGTMPNNGSPSHILPINGNVILPAGNYDGGRVYQSIPVFTGQTVNVGKNPVTVQIGGKYANGNISIPALANLTPPNIRKGKYVGGVGPGTWEGYVNNDPNMPFYYGTFGPGYAPVTFPARMIGGSYSKGSAGTGKNYYYLSGSSFESVAVHFTKQMDFSRYKKLKYLATKEGDNGGLWIAIAQNKVESYFYTGNSQSPTWNSSLGTIYYGPYNVTLGTSTEKEVDLSGINGTGYLYFFIKALSLDYQDFNIYYIKFE